MKKKKTMMMMIMGEMEKETKKIDPRTTKLG